MYISPESVCIFSHDRSMKTRPGSSKIRAGTAKQKKEERNHLQESNVHLTPQSSCAGREWHGHRPAARPPTADAGRTPVDLVLWYSPFQCVSSDFSETSVDIRHFCHFCTKKVMIIAMIRMLSFPG